MLTIEDISRRVATISTFAADGDDEAAHSREARLHCSVLRAIAELGGPGAELAAAALETTKIKFSRWYA